MYDPRAQAMFKRSIHNILSNFLISQDYYNLSKKSLRCNGSIYHIFKIQTEQFQSRIKSLSR